MAGIANLLEWIIVNEKAGYSFNYTPIGITFDEQVTRRFIIGIPRSKKFGKNPFLGTQRREAVFLKLLNITRAVIRENDNHLHLIASGLKGDGLNYPDLPPFVISMAFDNKEKAAIIAQAAAIDCRGYWIDDNNQIEIGAKAIIWSKPLLTLPEKAELIDSVDETDGPTFSDIIRMKIEATNVDSNPGFISSSKG